MQGRLSLKMVAVLLSMLLTIVIQKFATNSWVAELCKKFGSTQIDTMALFEFGDCTLLNTNDCPYELASSTIKKNKLTEKILIYY